MEVATVICRLVGHQLQPVSISAYLSGADPRCTRCGAYLKGRGTG